MCDLDFDKSAMSECRVCLVDNVRMHSIWNTRYKEIYEKLSRVMLNQKDGKPETICYLCSSLLQKLSKFFDVVQKSERILTLRLLGGIEMSQKTQDDLKLYNLATTSIKSTSYLDNGEDPEPEVTVTIKEEPIDFEESDEYKEEYLDSPPAEEISNDVDRSMETTPILSTSASHLQGRPLRLDKPTSLPNIFNMEFIQNDVSIKREATDCKEDNSDITKSILRNLGIAFENLPELELKYYPKVIKTDNHEKHYYCSMCSYKTRTSRALKNHGKVHSQSNPFVCEFCEYRFVNVKKLEHHRNYCTVCSICGKRFANIHGLRIHVRLHTGIQPYSCDSCGRGFNQKTNLQTHMRVHSRQNQYPCQICHKTFPYKTYLERHMSLHGEIPLDSESYRRTMNCHKLQVRKVNKPCVCSVCGRTLQSKNGLEVHMRQHTGERPFSCENCHKVFVQKCNLLTHIERVHKGDDSFSCRVCHQTFPFNWEMKLHLSTHKDEILSLDFEIFQQKHIYTIHRDVGHNGQLMAYTCDMCITRILSY